MRPIKSHDSEPGPEYPSKPRQEQCYKDGREQIHSVVIQDGFPTYSFNTW